MGKQLKDVFPSALRDTLALSIVVLPARHVVATAFDKHEAARKYRCALERKTISAGVPCVARDSASLIDVNRAMHQAEAAVRALDRFSKAAVVKVCISSLETYIGELHLQSIAIQDAPHQPGNPIDDFDLGGEDGIQHCPVSVKLAVLLKSSSPSLRLSKRILGRVHRALSRSLSTDHQPAFSHHQKRMLKLVLLGSLPSDVIHAYVVEQRLISALYSQWQRWLYVMFLQINKVPTLPDERSHIKRNGIVSTIVRTRGIILCGVYCVLATSFVIAFHLRQQAPRGISDNKNAYAAAALNTTVELLIVSPVFLSVWLVFLPMAAKAVLQDELWDAIKSLEDLSAKSSSGREHSLFGARAIGLNRAKKRFLELRGTRISNDSDIQPADDDNTQPSEDDGIQPTEDDNIELSDMYPSVSSTTSSDDSGIKVEVSGYVDDGVVLSGAPQQLDAGGEMMYPETSEELTTWSNPMHSRVSL